MRLLALQRYNLRVSVGSSRSPYPQPSQTVHCIGSVPSSFPSLRRTTHSVATATLRACGSIATHRAATPTADVTRESNEVEAFA